MSEWDDEIKCWVVRRTPNWIVLVTPMMFNDRVLLASHEEWRWGWTAGWCYDKGPAAALAAEVFDPETETDPVGFKKLAGDLRRTSAECAEVNLRVAGYY